jgi:hypothetical protein
MPDGIPTSQATTGSIESSIKTPGSSSDCTGGHPAYHASKGAVRIYSKAAAVRYGPSGVRVNTVHPGYMPPMLNATNAGERADKIAATPLRRIGKPIEVAYGGCSSPPTKGLVRHLRRTRHRRRLHRAVAGAGRRHLAAKLGVDDACQDGYRPEDIRSDREAGRHIPLLFRCRATVRDE